MQGGAPDAPLLVGIFTWPTREGARRRELIRQLMPLSEHVDRRFVMADGGNEYGVEASDMWTWRLPYMARAHVRQIGKFSLSNIFLQHAATLNHHFVLRTDDDALFNASAVAAQLIQLPQTMTHLVYGVSREWYMWNRAAMEPSCYAWSLRRWEISQQRAHSGAENGTAECQPAYIGPYLFTKGFFVGYSIALVRDMVALPAYSMDQDAVLSNWSGALHERRRSSGGTTGVRRRELLEDVYYSALIYEAWQASPLWFVQVGMSEYNPSRPPAGKLRPAIVYHRLKSRRHLNASGLLSARGTEMLRPWKGLPPEPKCKSLAQAYKRRNDLMHCCRQWVVCD